VPANNCRANGAVWKRVPAMRQPAASLLAEDPYRGL